MTATPSHPKIAKPATPTACTYRGVYYHLRHSKEAHPQLSNGAQGEWLANHAARVRLESDDEVHMEKLVSQPGAGRGVRIFLAPFTFQPFQAVLDPPFATRRLVLLPVDAYSRQLVKTVQRVVSPIWDNVGAKKR
jgi:hypothetical protein